MAVRPLFKESNPNFLSGLLPDQDTPSVFPEDNLSVPWALDAEASYIDYRCWTEVRLDPGMVLHKALPQSKIASDTLATVQFTDRDIAPGFASTKEEGVNMKPKADLGNIIQRMASSEFIFVLKGWGLRAGYKIPIPGLVSVGAAKTVPRNPHMAYNCVVGNFSGIPIFFATWELHYFVDSALGQSAKEPVPPNPAFRIRADAALPTAILLPRAPTDQRATMTNILIGGPRGPQR